jgi:hypothetical protein
MIPAEFDVHKARNEIVLAGLAIKLDPLDKGRSAIANPDNTYTNLILHSSTAFLKGDGSHNPGRASSIIYYEENPRSGRAPSVYSNAGDSRFAPR